MNVRRGLFLTVLVLAAAAAGSWQAAHSRPAAWSDASTWDGAPPRANADVTIPAGRTVVLDVPDVRLHSLTVDGELILANRDVRVEAAEITVHGNVWAGSERRRFMHNARIVLDGSPDGVGVLGADGGGRIHLWGAARQAWTRLTQTVSPGSRSVRVERPGDWRRGDRLVLAASGFDGSESEEVIVPGVAGPTIALAAPVRFRHWSRVTAGVDERAEVGLLTHNIVVTSEPAAQERGVGGQVMVMRGGRLEADGVDFAALGQRGRLGRYPIHFHLAGDARGSFVADSSIEHSLNRCLTIHGTDNVAVRENVAFDTIGHCYFLEDGVETGNVFDRNLALRIRAARVSEAILETDLTPAAYWIANPANTLRGNVAAGGDGHGFWYSLAPHPTGPSATTAVWPRRTPLAVFAGNVAHGNASDGLFVDILRNPPGVTEAPNYSPPATADFQTFVAYKNRKRGVWLRGTNLRLSNAVIADNSIGVTFAGAAAILRDSRVVGTTENDTGPPKPDDSAFPIRGFEFYDGQVGVERTQFANFVSTARRHASALSALRFSPFFTDPTNYARALSFENAERVFFEPQRARGDHLGADGYRRTVFRDLDGSVTGTPGAAVTIDSPLIAAAECRSDNRWNALICPANFGSVFVIGVASGNRTPGPVRVSLVAGLTDSKRRFDPLHSLLLHGNPDPARDAIFQTNLRASQTYSVSFRHAFPAHLRLGLHHFAPGEHLTLLFPQAPRDFALAKATPKPGAALSRRPDGTLVIDVSTDAAGISGANVLDECANGACS